MEHPAGDLGNGLDKHTRQAIGAAMGRIPQGLFVMTAESESRACGVLVSWVQQVSFEPPMVLVALRKGREIVPLVHDSHSFALNQVAQTDRLTRRKFTDPRLPDEERLQALEVIRRATGTPILAKSLAFLDCELIRHIDIEGDHDLYVGLVRDGGVLHPGEVEVRLREDGFNY